MFSLTFLLVLFFAWSCQKETTALEGQENIEGSQGTMQSRDETLSNITDVNDLKAVIETRSEKLSIEQREQAYRLRQAASVLYELVKSSSVRTEIISGVRSNYYEDESILFKDLFNSTQSPAFNYQSLLNINNGYTSKLQAGNYTPFFWQILIRFIIGRLV